MLSLVVMSQRRRQARERAETALRLVVEATSVQVCYDYEAKRSIPVPAELRRKLAS